MKTKQVLDSINSRSLRRMLRGLYHRRGPGRRPYNPLSMLKAQLLKHLLRIPSDRRLALRLKRDRKAARACGFRKAVVRAVMDSLLRDFPRETMETILETWAREKRGAYEP